MLVFPSSPRLFAGGTWTPELRKLLTRKPIPSWEPKTLIRRGTSHQWSQSAQKNWVPPYFWYGKPALMSSDAALFVGYYVERGLPPSDPKFRGRPAADPVFLEQMDERWHWHGFYRCLATPDLRDRLNAEILAVP